MSGEHHEIHPDQIADEIHQLHELDLEDVEHTEMGDIPSSGSGSFEQHFGTEPSVADQLILAARLDAHLADAEVEASADDLELARALAAQHDAQGEAPIDVSLEEIDDFEILAEADADDEDLLAAHGEEDSHDSITLPPEGARPSSEIDFAASLDLGDESDLYYAPGDEFSTHHVDSARDEFVDHSARNALAAFDHDELEDSGEDDRGRQAGRVVQPIFEPEPSSSFTLAGAPSESIDLEIPVSLPEPTPPGRHTRRAKQATRDPAMQGGAQLPSLLDSPVEDYELEHALEALDVDLDDLAIPHAATELQRDFDPTRSRPTAMIRPAGQARPQVQGRTPAATPARPVHPTGAAPAGRAPRMTTDDGLLIDFEDDD